MMLTPAQYAMSLLLGETEIMGWFGQPRREAIRQGRDELVDITGEDFGFDLEAWHAYLVQTDVGGYKLGNFHLGLADSIRMIRNDEEWKKAVAKLVADDSSSPVVQPDGMPDGTKYTGPSDETDALDNGRNDDA